MELILIQQKIHTIRDQQVMLDFDLAEMFDIETRGLKQSVRRNGTRFPLDFMFELTKEEWKNFLTSQTVMLENPSKYQPFAFTEHGVTMLASVLRSERAVQMNIAIVRAFVAMRHLASNYKEIMDVIQNLEKKMNHKFKDAWQALNFLLDKREEQGEWEDRNLIGFKRDGE